LQNAVDKPLDSNYTQFKQCFILDVLFIERDLSLLLRVLGGLPSDDKQSLDYLSSLFSLVYFSCYI